MDASHPTLVFLPPFRNPSSATRVPPSRFPSIITRLQLHLRPFPSQSTPFCLQLFASQFTVCTVYTACTVCAACIACGCAVCGVCTICGVLHIIQCLYDPYGRVISLLTCCVYLQVSYSSRILNLCLVLRRNAIRIATVRLPHVNVVYRFCSRSMQTCRVIFVLT